MSCVLHWQGSRVLCKYHSLCGIYRDQELSCANVPGHFYDLPRVCLIPCASLLSCCYSDAQKMKMLKKTENSSICAVI